MENISSSLPLRPDASRMADQTPDEILRRYTARGRSQKAEERPCRAPEKKASMRR